MLFHFFIIDRSGEVGSPFPAANGARVRVRCRKVRIRRFYNGVFGAFMFRVGLALLRPTIFS